MAIPDCTMSPYWPALEFQCAINKNNNMVESCTAFPRYTSSVSSSINLQQNCIKQNPKIKQFVHIVHSVSVYTTKVVPIQPKRFFHIQIRDWIMQAMQHHKNNNSRINISKLFNWNKWRDPKTRKQTHHLFFCESKWKLKLQIIFLDEWINWNKWWPAFLRHASSSSYSKGQQQNYFIFIQVQKS